MDEKVDPYPLIWADATMGPHQPGKSHLSSKRRNQRRGWVTLARIDENPGIRGHDLCFNKTCQGNRLAKHAEVEQKTIHIKSLAAVL